MSEDATTALHFEPPGPGSWALDPVHFPRPVTRYWAEMHPEPFRRGTHEFMAFYGAPIAAMVTQYVNGFAYSTMQPAPDEEIPERFARAEEVWATKVWRAAARRVGHLGQADRDRDAPRAAGSRRRCAHR